MTSNESFIARLDERTSSILDRIDKLEAKVDALGTAITTQGVEGASLSAKVKIAFAIVAALFSVLGGFAGNVVASLIAK